MRDVVERIGRSISSSTTLHLVGICKGNTPFKEPNCVLMLKRATGIVATDPEWFYVGYAKGRAE